MPGGLASFSDRDNAQNGTVKGTNSQIDVVDISLAVCRMQNTGADFLV